VKKFKDKQKKWDRNKSRPYIIESRWKEGSMDRTWKFYKPFTTEEIAIEAVETNLCKANFIEYRLVVKGEVQRLK